MPKCTVLLSLIQRNRRCLRAQGLTYLSVGFHVFQVSRAGTGTETGTGQSLREVGVRGMEEA